jgi:hypothetical protein
VQSVATIEFCRTIAAQKASICPKTHFNLQRFFVEKHIRMTYMLFVFAKMANLAIVGK